MGVKLANTGHLTFSTLHTNDAPSAVSRLYKMGVEPFLIAYAINLIVAQRLIRTLCEGCKERDYDPDPILLERMGFEGDDLSAELYKANPKGCAKCNGGYKGRRAITEALYFSRAIRHMIVTARDAIDEDAIRTQAAKEGMLTLQDSARVYALRGQTSVEEMMRVTASEG
jgi:type IV pilus assembly protein PilB